MNAAPLVRILIVDDEAALMRALCETLREQGYDAEGFTSGQNALAALQEKQFDLLLTDLMMPGMDGVALLAAALKIDPQLVGILMTGKGTIETAVQAMQAGALAGLIDARPGGAPARVLVVDDNVKALELVAAALEAEGYHVLRAYGGAEAIEAARSERPDLVILDLMMPEVSGFEVARALRDSEQTARIPILVLTAKDLTAEDRARLNGNVSAILAKASFSSSELLAELRRAIDSRAKG
jgi:CheY-like chemotaxis protein